eukprot:SAG25_NODE_212_length_11793_cov_15.035146_4_plen_103_part_00
MGPPAGEACSLNDGVTEDDSSSSSVQESENELPASDMEIPSTLPISACAAITCALSHTGGELKEAAAELTKPTRNSSLSSSIAQPQTHTLLLSERSNLPGLS